MAEIKETELAELKKRDNLLDTVHRAIVTLLASETDENTDASESILKSLELIGVCLDADRVEIWRNLVIDGELRSINTYQWLSEFGKKIKSVAIGSGIPFYDTPEWEKMFIHGGNVNSLLSQLTEKDQNLLNEYDIKSIALIPIFLQDEIWGFFSVDNCVEERLFSEDEIDILKSTSLMMASVLFREEMMQDVKSTAAQLDAVVSNYPGVIWSSDELGNLTLVNGLLLEELGIDPASIRESSSAPLFPRMSAMRQRAVETKQLQDWIDEGYGKNLHCRIIPVFDDDGGLYSVVGSVDDVTELIALQNRLKAENINALEQFQMIWESVDSGMFIIDTSDRTVLDVNPSAIRMFGGAREEMIGEKCYTFFGQHECPILDMNQTMDREERRFTKKDGTILPVIKSVVHIMYNGKPSLLESFTDITYMKEAEEKTRMADLGERVQVMLEANPHINLLLDKNEELIEFNQAAVSFMGFDSDEEMFEGFFERLADSEPIMISDGKRTPFSSVQFLTAVDKGTAKFGLEMLLDGVRRTLDVELKRIPYEDSYAVVAYIFDMTEVNERERELVRAHELNELQLVKLTLAAQAAQAGLWDMEVTTGDPTSSDNSYVWSDELRHMLGYTDENDFPDGLKSWSDRLHPDDWDRVFESYHNYLGDKTGDDLYEEEYRLRKKNGEYAYYLSTGKSIRDKTGSIVRLTGSLMDITETKNILLDSERQKIEAEAANKAKSAFLSTMSHEIRTPMNAILGVTEIQLQNDEITQNVREAFEQIYNSGDMLLGIINDILDLSKIEAGKMNLVVAQYETASLLSDAAQLNMMRIGSKPIEFELEVDENTPVALLGDELRIKQVLNNILSNAIKYTSSGVVKLSVQAQPTGTADTVELLFRINDTGQGMSEEQVAKIFEEYARFNTEANRSTEGTGLGMSITQGLLDLMGGRISIESELGEGTTVTILLPQGVASMEVLGKESAENLHRFRSRSRAQMRRMQIFREPMPYGSVLVVDDTEANIYVAKGLLAPYELEIDSVSSGFAAIELLEQGNEYDIIFMDHMMPVMDGIEATQIIRGMGYKRSIVALTASAGSGQAEKFLENGFDDYISKPIDVRQLNAVLNKLIRDKYPLEAGEIAKSLAQGQVEGQGQVGSVVQHPAQPQPADDPQFIEIFLRDISKSLAVLDELNKKDSFSDDDMHTYVIYTHSMKGVLANIGNKELSGLALKLETAGRNEDFKTIVAQTPQFLQLLREFVDEFKPKTAKGAKETCLEEEVVDEDKSRLNEKLLEIKAACDAYDGRAADDIIQSLRGENWSASIDELLQTIAVCLLHSEFDEAAEIIDKYLAEV